MSIVEKCAPDFGAFGCKRAEQVMSRAVLVLLVFVATSALANEQVGILVRRVTDACVGAVLMQNRELQVALVRASRTVTGLCTCAAEVAIARGISDTSPDALVRIQEFHNILDSCLKAGAR